MLLYRKIITIVCDTHTNQLSEIATDETEVENEIEVESQTEVETEIEAGNENVTLVETEIEIATETDGIVIEVEMIGNEEIVIGGGQEAGWYLFFLFSLASSHSF